jgi:hypothetical protein
MLAFPRTKLAALGVFDTIYNLLSTWPVPAIGGPVSNVLSQSVVPLNLALSISVLRTRFTRLHYIGALMAVYGVLVRMIPSLSGEAEAGGNATGISYVFWVLVMIASQIPAALSNVYKEVALKGAERLDVWYTNAVISTWQLGFGLVVLPLAALPFSPDHVDLSKLPQYAADATTCFMGGSLGPEYHCADEATSGVVLFAVFLVFNITYNLLSLAVMQEGSSALFVVASAVRLPLVDILLLWPWLAGVATATFTIFDGFALVALLLAIYLYNADEEKESEQPARTLSELASLALWAASCGRIAGGCDRDGMCGFCCCHCIRCPARVSAAGGVGGGSGDSGGDYSSHGEVTRLMSGTKVGAGGGIAADDGLAKESSLTDMGGFDSDEEGARVRGFGGGDGGVSVSGLSMADMDTTDHGVGDVPV